MAATASLRVLQSKTDGVACLVEVPHALLLAWHSTVSTKADYLECLNKSVPDDAQLSVRIDSSRLANRLAASASRLRTKERGLSGRGKMLLRSGTATFEVKQGETVVQSNAVESLQSTIAQHEETITSLQQQLSARPSTNSG